MLTIEQLCVRYGKQPVLKNLDLVTASGSIHGIVGVNGSGKTTLLQSIYGLRKVDSGSIQWDNQAITPALIAYLETQNYFYHRITGKEYLELFRIRQPNFDYKAWNGLFQLPLNELIDHYSTGMKKKLAFLGILSQKCPILILDEPFNSIDLETNLQIKAILQEMKSKGKLILTTSHILETLTTFCDQIHLLEGGKISRSFTPDEFPDIEKIIAKRSEGLALELSRQLLG